MDQSFSMVQPEFSNQAADVKRHVIYPGKGIDPKRSACEVDDLIACEVEEWGALIRILIADAPSRIPKESEIERIALERRASVYDSVGRLQRPMLPPQLTERLSLREHEIRPAIAFTIPISRSGYVGKAKIERVMAYNETQSTYRQVDRLINAGDRGFKFFLKAGERLRRKWKFHVHGGRTVAEQLVQTYMVTAHLVAAELHAKAGAPALFFTRYEDRNHYTSHPVIGSRLQVTSPIRHAPSLINLRSTAELAIDGLIANHEEMDERCNDLNRPLEQRRPIPGIRHRSDAEAIVSNPPINWQSLLEQCIADSPHLVSHLYDFLIDGSKIPSLKHGKLEAQQQMRVRKKIIFAYLRYRINPSPSNELQFLGLARFGQSVTVHKDDSAYHIRCGEFCASSKWLTSNSLHVLQNEVLIRWRQNH